MPPSLPATVVAAAVSGTSPLAPAKMPIASDAAAARELYRIGQAAAEKQIHAEDWT